MKSVIKFVRMVTYRDVIVAWLRTNKYAKDTITHVITFSVSFAKWRWGTLYLCATAVLKVDETQNSKL